jgi:hypothetical protein
MRYLSTHLKIKDKTGELEKGINLHIHLINVFVFVGPERNGSERILD